METSRKTGEPVATLVWFADEHGTFSISSLAHAGRVNRIRQHLQVSIVPCAAGGPPKGAWVDARARILDARGAARGPTLLNQQYGWVQRIGEAFRTLSRSPRVVIALALV